MSSLANSSSNTPAAPEFAASLQRAYVYAEEQGQRQVTVEHVLLALSEDQDAINLLTKHRINLDHLRNEVAGLVSRNDDRFPPGQAGHPSYGADLLRVLDTAAGAATRSRPIDGALVLSAIIADGRTPAAELIRLYGLTFEDVIRPAAKPARPASTLENLRSTARDAALGVRSRRPPARAVDPIPASPPASRPLPIDTTQRLAALRRSMLPTEEPVVDLPQWSEPRPHDNDTWHDPAPAEARSEPPEAWSEYGDGAADSPPPQPETDAPVWEDGYIDPTAPGYATGPALSPPVPAVSRRREPPMAQFDEPATSGHRAAAKARRRAPLRDLLTENIPRRQRVGQPQIVEARIRRHDLVTAIHGLLGPGQSAAPGQTANFATSVRLRAPQSGFAIEPNSPETQWIESTIGLMQDDFASWRWTVTPKAPGYLVLQLIVSARMVDADGLSAETALPDQSVNVRVSGNFGRALGRVAGWVAAAIAAGGIGAFGEHMLRIVGRILGH